MFLKPTANPTPRRTPSPRVVLPAPPGSRIGSRGSASGSGTGIAAARRITSATGSDPVSTWPVGSVSPVSIAFSSRSSIGSMPERLGQPVHLRLGREAGLHRAEPAHRAARRVVGVDGGPLDQGVVDAVRADRERRGVRDHRRRARGVRAAVDQDPHVDADEASVARRAMLRPDLGRVPVDVADERLLAVVDDLHRPVGVERQHRGVDLDREILATAERTADPARGAPAPARARARGTGPSGRGRRGATASRRRCRCRPRRREPRCPTRGRGTPDPGCRARRRPRPSRRPATSGSPCRITIVRTTFGRGSSR